MNQEEEEFLNQQQKEIEVANANSQSMQIAQSQQNAMVDRQEMGMAKEQLNLDKEIQNIEHLLRGRVQKINDRGIKQWTEPEDKQMIILSEYGVQLIINTIKWYMNKNTLLSNYSEEVIYQKMEDFAGTLADAIFMEYENVFQYPSFDECKEILIERIERKKDLKIFSLELIGKEVDEDKQGEIEKELLLEVEGKVEGEIEKIKEQLIKNKLKRFELLIRVVQDAVHSTYQRAWKGQERSSLRKHWHVSENSSPQYKPQTSSKMNPLSWIKPR